MLITAAAFIHTTSKVQEHQHPVSQHLSIQLHTTDCILLPHHDIEAATILKLLSNCHLEAAPILKLLSNYHLEAAPILKLLLTWTTIHLPPVYCWTWLQ